MEKISVKEFLIKIFWIVLAAFIYALGIKLIVQQEQLLSGGVSGLTVLLSRFIALNLDKEELESVLYSVIYILFNIPIFIFGFKKVGKQFIYYSILNVILFSLFVSLIPASWYQSFQLNTIDKLTSSIVAGLLAGFSSVIAFANGFSSGGTDIISMYLSRSKGKGIGSYSFAMNIFILVAGGIMFKDFNSLIYTVIYFFATTLVVNNLYIGHKKVLVEIVTDHYENLTQRLMQESHHGCTILDAIGAYSKQEKKILRIVVSSNQIRRICGIINEIDKDSFTTLIEVKQVAGRFYLPPIK